jgi:hypothetical protein
MDEESAPTETTQTDTEVVETTPVVETSSESTPESDTSLQARLSAEDYAYVQSLREEAKTNRQTADRYKTSFDGFDDDTTDAFLQAVKLIRENPAEAHDVFKGLTDELAVAAGITKAEAKEIVQDAVDNVDNTDGPVFKTQAELDEYLEQREAKKQQDVVMEQARKEIDNKIAELGYKPGTKQFNDLMFFASSLEEGSPIEKLEAAHNQIAEERQAVIDEYLAEQKRVNDAYPPQTDGSAVVTTGSDKPKSINDAAKAARQVLDATYSDSE